MRHTLLLFITILLCFHAKAQKAIETIWQVTSPDNKLVATIERNIYDGSLKYIVHYIENGQAQAVIESSKLGIGRIDQSFTNNLVFESILSSVVDENYTMKTGKQLQLRNNANEITLTFRNQNNAKIQIIFRAYNDGIAFRYRFPEKSDEMYYVTEDKTTFQVSTNSKGFFQKYQDYQPVYESLYEKVFLNQPYQSISYPALLQTPNAWVLITEADLQDNFFGSHIGSYGGNGTLNIATPNTNDGYGSPFFAQSTLPWTMPWRVIMIGKELNTIVESNVVSHVSSPSTITNTSWITPALTAWSWWSSLDSPTDYNKLKNFIDFTATFKLPYFLVDANWNNMGNGGNINDIINYANFKNVKLWLWYNSGGPSNGWGEQPRDLMHIRDVRRQEFARIKALGIKGVKIDFFQSDKQEIIKLYIDILKDAAEYQLMVNFHGCTVPKGWSRTYPNLVAMEAVKGSEAYIFDGDNFRVNAPAHHTILPFTRNVIGSMDYTPTIIGEGRGVVHYTTDVHEIALLGMFESGQTHLVDRAESYTNLPVLAKTVISNLPTTWDETRLVDGFPSDFVVMARRKGENWYISGVNGQNDYKAINLSFPFVENGDYIMQHIADGTTPRDILTAETDFTLAPTTEPKQILMKAYGGFLIVLKRKECQRNITISGIHSKSSYVTSESIKSTSSVTQNTVYESKAITLEAGFKVEAGTVFQAKTGGCKY